MRRPDDSAGCDSVLPVMSHSARNMPVDSIITTIITSTMVRISTGSKIGMPKWNGMIGATQAAFTTLSKCMRPSAAAMQPPTTMPISTAMLETKPLPKRATPITTARTTSESAMLDTGA